MLVDQTEEKLINAMIFFTKETKYCYKLKLYKLLYFLDFKHFKKTGLSVTGLDYFAWPMGPVPKLLDNEIKSLTNKQRKLKNCFNVFTKPGFNGVHLKSTKNFNDDVFSKREMEIITELASIFREAKGKDMTIASHECGSPWSRIYNAPKKKNDKIPYEYILDEEGSISKEEATERQHEDKEMKRIFGTTG